MKRVANNSQASDDRCRRAVVNSSPPHLSANRATLTVADHPAADDDIMNVLAILRVALKALGQNALRTGLTMLGIVIGVGAVICVIAIGEGASASVERAITNIDPTG